MKNSFETIINKGIEIPIIQRDYAQGRKEKKVEKIRQEFLDVLFDAILKHSENNEYTLDLDFIYGYIKVENMVFIPIDGQQRLTTLWLLYYFVSRKEKQEFKSLSNFIYETRHSSTVFCQKLCQFIPEFDSYSLSKEIRNQHWYLENWDYDPTIDSMLRMLDAIETMYNSLENTPLWPHLISRGGPFAFYQLEMSEIGLTDDLYIKMNSRGKPLTEFEYFKAHFSEIIQNDKLRMHFETQIDQQWTDAIWMLVKNNSEEWKEDDDIALVVDQCFLNLFNFLTKIIAYKKEIPYQDTYQSKDALPEIYQEDQDFSFTFDLLDTISQKLNEHSVDWNYYFYYGLDNFSFGKSRLFFVHESTDLLSRCIFYFDKSTGFSLPEQLLFYFVILDWQDPIENMESYLRELRNIVINSSDELREKEMHTIIPELEAFFSSQSVEAIKSLNTDQIREEERKRTFKSDNPNTIEIMNKLEDSNFLRGKISILSFDNNFDNRAEKFLEYFNEKEFLQHYIQRANALLAEGDYKQMDNNLFNLMSYNTQYIRRFLTAPGYGKNKDVFSKTRPVIESFLDKLIADSHLNPNQIIKEYLKNAKESGFDWRYYFQKYPSFRESCNKGYYYLYNSEEPYVIAKMKEKQFNGYHWCPFLDETYIQLNSKKLDFTFNPSKLIISRHKSDLGILFLNNAIQFTNLNRNGRDNWMLIKLQQDKLVNKKNQIKISQNENGLDTQDRIKKLVKLCQEILEWDKS